MAQQTRAPALGRLRVVDLTDSIAGQFAARLLADVGAQVVLVEPTRGCGMRRRGPFVVRDGAEPRSLLFEHLNGGKRSRLVDAVSDERLNDIARLCAEADAVLVDDPTTAASLRAQGITALIVEFSPFGRVGPYARWQATELVLQALSGTMYITGLDDHEPLYGVGHRASFAAGAFAFIGVMADLHRRLSTGEGASSLEITEHEAAAAMEQNLSTQWSYSGTVTRRGNVYRPKGMAKCSDGWVVYFIHWETWPGYCEAFRAAELVGDPRFASRELLAVNWREAREELDRHAADLTVAEVMAVAMRLGLVVAPVKALGALAEDEQLVDRGFWKTTHSARGDLPALGAVFQPSRIAVRRDQHAPLLGEGGEWDAGVERLPLPRRVGATGLPPLTGIRVLDFTSAWAGPMAAKLLGVLGATVVKVEGPGRLDSWRFETSTPSQPPYYPDSSPGPRPWNRSAWYNSQNHNKLGLGIDLKSPGGARVLRALADQSDVLIANWSPGALDRAGLGYAELAPSHPGVIVVEMPAAGNSGPLRGMRGLGPTMEAMAGMTSLIGYPDLPTGSGSAYLDPTGALHGAAATLTALVHRDLTGEGQAVEVAQQEAATHWIGDYILDSVVNGTVYASDGNAVPDAAPHGAFPTAGDDQWIAFGAFDDRQWAALCAVLGGPGLATEEQFATHASRVANRDALTERLSALTRTEDKLDLAARLQDAGVPAASVHTGRDLFHDEHLRAREWFTELAHPEAGTHEYSGYPFLFDGARVRPVHGSPIFGQHNTHILRDFVGLSDDEIEALRADGAIADEPAGYDAPNTVGAR